MWLTDDGRQLAWHKNRGTVNIFIQHKEIDFHQK
jgi:hypothetical protein